MPDNERESEAKLRKLGERFRQGWAKLHPLKESQLQGVRRAIRHEWEQKTKLQNQKSAQQQGQEVAKTVGHGKSKTKTRTKTSGKSHEHEEGHSH